MNTSEIIEAMAKPWKPVKLAYCDAIAFVLRNALRDDVKSPMSYVKNVGGVQWDLHPEEGYMMSTAKTIMVEDKNGKTYKVTVEEYDA
jgi:hypothetical protein